MDRQNVPDKQVGPLPRRNLPLATIDLLCPRNAQECSAEPGASVTGGRWGRTLRKLGETTGGGSGCGGLSGALALQVLKLTVPDLVPLE